MNNAFDLAAKQIGLNETGQKSALQDYLTTGGQNLDPATTAWCAAFVNATLAQSGQQGTGKLNARSYLDWGQAVDAPQQGDVAVFSRGDPNGWQGHVGFFDGYNSDGTIRVLGGNQGDSVSISSYNPSSLLGFRRGSDGNALSRPAEAMPHQNALAGALPPPSIPERTQPQLPQLGGYLDPAQFTTQPTNALAQAPQYRISSLSRRNA